MGASVRVEGARELDASMRRAGDDLADMTGAHTQAGALLVQRAKALAPMVSGRLAASIRADAADTTATVTAGSASVPYAGPIHWGWAARNIRAQPFLTSALDQAESSVLDTYAGAVDSIVATIHGK